MPWRGNDARRRNSCSSATDANWQRVDGPRHNAADTSLNVVLGARHEMIQSLQSRPRLLRLTTIITVNVVAVVLADLVEHGVPAQLGRQIVEERTYFDRAADKHAQVT